MYLAYRSVTPESLPAALMTRVKVLDDWVNQLRIAVHTGPQNATIVEL